MRRVTTKPRYEGKPCGDLIETEACNMQSCDQDCKLGSWSKFSTCSRACGKGHRFSTRKVKTAAVGRGKCSGPKTTERLKKLPCNTHSCPGTMNVLKCKAKVDLVILLDGSGSVGTAGWALTKQFATKFVEGFDGQDAQVSIILFSGPSTWKNYQKCTSPGAASLDMAGVCGLTMVSHFSSDMAALKTSIGAINFPRKSTFTAGALDMARNELMMARSDSTRVVLTLTDGVPISTRKTWYAAHEIKKRARLIMGAVKLSSRGQRYMRYWASRPSRDNVLVIKDFKELAKVSTMNAIIRDVCPKIALS